MTNDSSYPTVIGLEEHIKMKNLPREPLIVAIDDLDGGFEFVYWCKDTKEAESVYEDVKKNLPDREGRHAHIFILVKDTTGYDCSPTRVITDPDCIDYIDLPEEEK